MPAFDSSALLAFVQGELGGDECEALLTVGGVVSAANWSELCQKVQASPASWTTVRALLLSYPLTIEPVTAADAELAAALWQSNSHLSLGDRLALATAERLGEEIWTTDRAWGDGGRARQLR